MRRWTGMVFAAMALVLSVPTAQAKQMTNTEAICFLLPGGFEAKVISEITKKPPICILTIFKKKKR